MTTNGNGHTLTLEQLAVKNGHRPPEPTDAHTCPWCFGPIETCEYRDVLETRRLAKSIIMAANQLEMKLSGVVPQRGRRNRDFTPEEAKQLVKDLGSFRAAAKKIGVSTETIQRAVIPRAEWPSHMTRHHVK